MQDLAQWNAHFQNKVPAEALTSTVPFIIALGGELATFGTGTLFRIGEVSLIVTALHVFKEAEKQGGELLLGIEGQAFEELQGEYRFASGAREQAEADIAVFRLSDRATARLKDKTFLTLSDVGFQSYSPSAMFGMVGFPSRLAERRGKILDVQPVQMIAPRYERPVDDLSDYDGSTHLLIEARLDATTNLDGSPLEYRGSTGEKLHYPGDLGGISGCGVWHIGDWNPSVREGRPRLVGVQTGVYRGAGAVKATLWKSVAGVIWDSYPEVRPIFSLARP